jgi:hypothetical protein
MLVYRLRRKASANLQRFVPLDAARADVGEVVFPEEWDKMVAQDLLARPLRRRLAVCLHVRDEPLGGEFREGWRGAGK